MPERRFRRIPFAAQVEVSTGQKRWTCNLIDIALKGALVETSERLPISPGDACSLCIMLPGSELALDFKAELVHQEDDHYGFMFRSESLETLTHLRKLIELNTGDTEATRHELTSWLQP